MVKQTLHPLRVKDESARYGQLFGSSLLASSPRMAMEASRGVILRGGERGFNFQDCNSTVLVPQGVLRISSDGDDRMGAKIKTQKTPWTKN